jgi:hypothetical protein
MAIVQRMAGVSIMRARRGAGMHDPLADRMGKRMKRRVGIAVRRGMVVQYDDGMDGIFIMHHGAMPTRQADRPGHRQQSQQRSERRIGRDGSP